MPTTKRHKQTPQDRNRRRTERRLIEADGRTLFIEGLNRAEVDALRARVFYSGASDTYIASFGSALALATVELLKMRGRRKATVRVRGGDLVLTAKRVKAS